MTPVAKRTLAAIVGAVALMVAGAAAAQDIKPRLIRFGYGLSADSVQGRAVKHFTDELSRLSGGKLKVRPYGDASLGSDVQMQQALVGGAQEMMVGSTATLVGTVPAFGVYDLPFMIRDEAVADKVLDGPFGQKLLRMLEDKGLVGLVYWENGFRDLTNTKRPIDDAKDLDGIKLRVMQNPVFLDTFKTLGANAVPLPFSELFTALETRAVDGQENPVTTILSSKFYEVQKYLSLSHHAYSPWIVLVSKKWWDGLSADEQTLVRQAAVSSRDFQRQDNRKSMQDAIAKLKDHGMQVNDMPDDALQAMQKDVQPVVERMAQQLGTDIVNEYRQAVQEAGGKL